MCKIFHLTTKLIVNDSDIDKTFENIYSNKIAINYLLSPFFSAIYSSYTNDFSFVFLFCIIIKN